MGSPETPKTANREQSLGGIDAGKSSSPLPESSVFSTTPSSNQDSDEIHLGLQHASDCEVRGRKKLNAHGRLPKPGTQRSEGVSIPIFRFGTSPNDDQKETPFSMGGLYAMGPFRSPSASAGVGRLTERVNLQRPSSADGRLVALTPNDQSDQRHLPMPDFQGGGSASGLLTVTTTKLPSRNEAQSKDKGREAKNESLRRASSGSSTLSISSSNGKGTLVPSASLNPSTSGTDLLSPSWGGTSKPSSASNMSTGIADSASPSVEAPLSTPAKRIRVTVRLPSAECYAGRPMREPGIERAMAALSIAGSKMNDSASDVRLRAASAPPAVEPSSIAVKESTEETNPFEATHPYLLDAETPPEHEFHTSEFQNKLQEGVGTAKKAVEAIQRIRLHLSHDPRLERLLQEAKRLAAFQSTDTRTIAILGSSGEGKSSLINSLLHLPRIAQTGDIGSACTSVVTEYRQKKPGQTTPIYIEVELLPAAAREELVNELLWSYRQFYLPDMEKDKMLEEEYATFERRSNTAWSALAAAFAHKKGFTPEFARDMSYGASERISEQLTEWTRDIESPDGISASGLWTCTATTADECCSRTRAFMQNKLWPFTKIIRVFLESPVLKAGIVLADLPGLQDTNLARVKATQDYLLKCDNIFVVGNISRAVTDQSIKSSLYLALSQQLPMEWEQSGGKELKIAVICTKSEDINCGTAKAAFCGPDKRITSGSIEVLEAAVESAKAAGDHQRKKSAKKKIEALLIEARNAHVKEGLQRSYSSKFPQGTLNVFCVSNKMYEKSCRKGNTELVRLSGVPDLRRFCRSLAADSQLREANHLLQSSLLVFFNSLGIWCELNMPSSQEEYSLSKRNLIRTYLEEVYQVLSRSAAKLNSDLMKVFQELVMRVFDQRGSRWEDEASRHSRTWETQWHWTQYRAWCANDGCPDILKRGHVDWNAEITSRMRRELQLGWEFVFNEIPPLFKDLFDDIVLKLDVLGSLLSGLPFRGERRAAIMTRRSIKFELDRQLDQLHQEIREVKAKSSESNASSYIFVEMLPYYRRAKGQEDTGSAARHREIVGGHIQHGPLFPNIGDAMKGDMASVIQRAEERVVASIENILEKLKVDIYTATELVPPQGLHQDPAKIREFSKKMKELEEKLLSLKE